MSDTRGVVWILGAGFSRSLGAPLLDGLFSEEAGQRISALYPDPERHRKFSHGVRATYNAGVYDVKHLEKHCKARLWQHAEEFIETLDRIAEDEKGKGLERLVPVMGAKVTLTDVKHLRDCAKRMMAAECSEFLEHADTDSERWIPYMRWAEGLSHTDTVLTFNYDRVPDLLRAKAPRGLWIPSPKELVNDLHKKRANQPLVLKLHGSVDWICRDNTVEAAVICPSFSDNRTASLAALYCPPEEIAIGTPGVTKHRMVTRDECFAPLWSHAAEKIKEAHTIVFVGYRIPPTDAFSRRWLAENIGENLRLKNSARKRGVSRHDSDSIHDVPEPSSFFVHTVLGDDVHSSDSARLKGLLEAIDPRLRASQHAMWAQDFLDVWSRERLLDASRD